VGGRVDLSKQYDLLLSCPVVDDAAWLRHLTGFVTAFVAPAKRERWRELLTRRPRRVGKDSHKLHSDRDRRTCRCEGTAVPETLTGDGAFYAFTDVPRVVPESLVLRPIFI
jgi:hypothetical protein